MYIKLLKDINPIAIYNHKTFEIVDIIGGKCDLIITMNITLSLLSRVASKKKTVLYFASASKDPVNLVKERFFIGEIHAKIYRTNTHVIVSTANLSLSSWNEVSVKFPRTLELDEFINQVVRSLNIKKNYYAHFW